jgi:hypothetical protein
MPIADFRRVVLTGPIAQFIQRQAASIHARRHDFRCYPVGKCRLPSRQSIIHVIDIDMLPAYVLQRDLGR